MIETCQCTKSWRAVGYQNIAAGTFPSSSCTADSCEYAGNGNFLSLESKNSFEKFRTPVYKDDGSGTMVLDTDHPGYFSLQLAWKVDDCTVAVLGQ